MNKWVVNMINRTCARRKLELIGLPGIHACAIFKIEKHDQFLYMGYFYKYIYMSKHMIYTYN